MNFLAILLVSLVLSVAVFAADAADNDAPQSKVQSSADYNDGGSLDQLPISPRDPASAGEIPYTDEELQKNSPENYAPKNMPIDQD